MFETQSPPQGVSTEEYKQHFSAPVRPGIEGALRGLGRKQQEGAWEALPAPGLGARVGLGQERERRWREQAFQLVIELHQVLALV